MHDTIHTFDQLAYARSAAIERQRQADELRAIDAERAARPNRPYWSPTSVRRAVVAGGLAVVATFVVLGDRAPAAAEVATGESTIEYDTHTGSHARLQPGLPDGYWLPDATTARSHLAGRVR